MSRSTSVLSSGWTRSPQAAARRGDVMSRLREASISAVLISIALSLLVATSQRAPGLLQDSASTCRASATPMARLELLFGMSRADGRSVAESEWQMFVDREVTPRFPQGLTVMSGSGQWRSSDGTIAKERSRMLIVWYPTRGESEASIEAIRSAYKARFSQESVMRVDSSSCVSF